MNPVRHVGNRDYLESEREKLNSVLAFSGLTLGEDGKLREVTTARTLTEAEAIARVLIGIGTGRWPPGNIFKGIGPDEACVVAAKKIQSKFEADCQNYSCDRPPNPLFLSGGSYPD